MALLNTKARNVSSINIRPDGTMVITDAWQSFASNGIRLKRESDGDNPFSRRVGVLDFGILKGEEPEISGSKGTGAIYIHGCPLRCETCYQPEFFSSKAPSTTNEDGLEQLATDLRDRGAESISFVIGTWQPQLQRVIARLSQKNLGIPIVYNYSGMVSPRLLDTLIPFVDIFVPDMKAISKPLGQLHGLPKNYTESATTGIRHLINSDRRVIIRHLYHPDHIDRVNEATSIGQKFASGRKNVTLSLLTNFIDPATGKFYYQPPQELLALRELAKANKFDLYFQETSL